MTINKNIYIGNHEAYFSHQQVKGQQVNIGKETYYKISNVDVMRPFFMSIVSNSNHWMFISSLGSLSAGRKDSNNALFPYYTDDKITESAETTGSKTIFLVSKSDKTFLWEPFSVNQTGVYHISRNLYKNAYGNKVVFEEINHDLSLTFSYEWNSSDIFGFVRKSKITHHGSEKIQVDLIDGIQNILPYGVEEALQNSTSNLVDAYKKCELEKDTGLGIYSLSAIIVDKAEPSEALKANIVWSVGLKDSKKLLSSLQLNNFRKGFVVTQEEDIKAEKGAYFLNAKISLGKNSSEEWIIVADVNKSIPNVIQLKENIKTKKDIASDISKDIEAGSLHLLELVGAADGIQKTADNLRNIRHFSNTMFNIMRGGIFDHNYEIEKSDFIPYIASANKEVYAEKASILEPLPEIFTLSELKLLFENEEDPNFKRLCSEYLPLMFSRRHGDPSRPWNKFSINTQNEDDGSKVLDYQGNWRDIFQNWEALAHSYPAFINGMMHKFLNATTFDGYNPYRVTKGGFDWETIEPDNPWAYIGYWGDHQIIYLLKFLEFIEDYYPNTLSTYFTQDLFVYANVPYQIKKYREILKDSKNTIDFDHEEEAEIHKKRNKIGVDGALLGAMNSSIYQVNFIEKILATVLAKMSNFIPQGGIWMNTQRPEWNDANNALVGNGVSMVTLYYLRRFLDFFFDVVKKSDVNDVEISQELQQFLNQITDVLVNNRSALSSAISDTKRKTILDGLGQAGCDYRTSIYEHQFSGVKHAISKSDIETFLEVSLEYLEHSIRANQRNDALYHAYNLMTLRGEDKVEVSHLSEMLEGQVAVLSSGYLTSLESLKVLDALKASSLFRPDQYSYILYPNKDLPRFVHKNTIPKQKVLSSPLLTKLVKDGNHQILTVDCIGEYHFNGSFNNVNSLKKALQELPEHYMDLVHKESDTLYHIFEHVFDHKSFTGRSGTFFGYEGLGSIYWHMVSKLLLAVLEVTQKAIDQNDDNAIIGRLFDHYFEINAGIGVDKSPDLYGAFPTDAYSHTPEGKGAQQPGMTGQVKEDILSRFGELGVHVNKGILGFNPVLLQSEEFLNEKQLYHYITINKQPCVVELEKDSLGFTYCQVPVVYKKSAIEKVEVHLSNGSTKEFMGKYLDSEMSTALFKRTNEIKKIVVWVKKN